MADTLPTCVTLWVVRPDEVPEALLTRYRSLLTVEESDRCERFVFDRHRREYLVTRALVRSALSAHRDVAPAAWRFVRGERGKPSIAPPCGLEFNLSNHPTMVACGVAEGAALGVDVEPLSRGDEILELASTVFSPVERSELAKLSPRARASRAVSLWTAKEAYIKARGDGLSLPLQEITILFARARTEEEAATGVALSPAIDDGSSFVFGASDIDGHRIHVAAAAEKIQLRVVRTIPLAD